jgi:hypothetical protein
MPHPGQEAWPVVDVVLVGEIARRLGISRNTVRSALATDRRQNPHGIKNAPATWSPGRAGDHSVAHWSTTPATS